MLHYQTVTLVLISNSGSYKLSLLMAALACLCQYTGILQLYDELCGALSPNTSYPLRK